MKTIKQRQCPRCGRKQNSVYSFCSICGAEFSDPALSMPVQMPDARPLNIDQPPLQNKSEQQNSSGYSVGVESLTCPRCSAPQTGQSRYCHVCGYDMQNIPIVQGNQSRRPLPQTGRTIFNSILLNISHIIRRWWGKQKLTGTVLSINQGTISPKPKGKFGCLLYLLLS